MPITISKYTGQSHTWDSTFTCNNFVNLAIEGNTPAEVIGDVTDSDEKAILIKFLGPTTTINFDWILMDESSTVVTGTGGTVTTARDQLRYLYNVLMSTGTSQILDSVRIIIYFSSTALDSGTATAGAASTLTDGGKTWTTNAYAYKVLKITGGTGANQIRTIASNTGTVLTVTEAWDINPDNTSTYQIIDGFQRGGVIIKITNVISSDQPLTIKANISFSSGTVT